MSLWKLETAIEKFSFKQHRLGVRLLQAWCVLALELQELSKHKNQTGDRVDTSATNSNIQRLNLL